MKRTQLVIVCVYLFLSTALLAEEFPTIGDIERLDPALGELVPAGANIQVLADGFEWSEGPVWLPSEKCVLFSDIPNNAVHRWDAEHGLQLYLQPAGFTGTRQRGGEPGSNGLTLDPQNRLLLCQHGDRRVARMKAQLGEPKSDFETVADQYQGQRFNSPNDLVVHSTGAIYFTDPPYGLEKNMDDPAKEIPFQGVYRIDTDGTVHLLTDKLTRPNGLAFSPDEKSLYVAVSDPQGPVWMKYAVASNGELDEGTLFFDGSELAKTRRGLPDGMKVDQRGNLWATGPGGVLVISPEAKHLGTLRTTQATANCAFGDDGKTLYITADMYLLRVRLETKGVGF